MWSDIRDGEEQYCGQRANRVYAAIARFLPPRGVVSRHRPERLSVVHVLAPGEFGGLESVVRLMVVGQRRRGLDVLLAPIVAKGRRQPAWLSTLGAAGARIEPIVAPPRAYLSQWRLLRELFHVRRPSVVHTHGYHADVLAGHAAGRAGVPATATVHGFVGGDRRNRAYEMLQRWTLRRFDAVIAVSQPMAAELRDSGVPGHRLHVVPNAFESDGEPLTRATARRELGVTDAAFQLGWIGRLSPEKGPDIMLSALSLLSDDKVRLSILGSGPERERLESQARTLGIEGRVTWHGVQLGAARLATAFDAIVLSSRAEGTPIVLFEAMAAGTPIVASRVGGIPDVLTEAEAVLVPPGDPAALAAALQAMRLDPTGAAARAAAARRRLAQEFSTARWLDRIDDVYAAAMRAHADRGSR
jgi:glycosyltransferase involved in cell wall biosynthesis